MNIFVSEYILKFVAQDYLFKNDISLTFIGNRSSENLLRGLNTCSRGEFKGEIE